MDFATGRWGAAGYKQKRLWGEDDETLYDRGMDRCCESGDCWEQEAGNGRTPGKRLQEVQRNSFDMAGSSQDSGIGQRVRSSRTGGAPRESRLCRCEPRTAARPVGKRGRRVVRQFLAPGTGRGESIRRLRNEADALSRRAVSD